MNPEREIVNWWLNQRGFFTLHNIKASKNREVDILAMRMQDGKVDKVQQVELACSITSIDNFKPEEFLVRFDDKIVANKIGAIVKVYAGTDAKYDKILIVGSTSRLTDLQKLPGITTIHFSDVLLDVMKSLDTWYYKDEVIRTLQLLKYILLADPEKLATLLEEQEKNKILKLTTRKDFIKSLLGQTQIKKALSQETVEKELIEILKNSTLNQPEKLAQVLEEEILGPRSRKRFLNALLKYEGVKEELKVSVNENESLKKFFG